MSRATGVKAEYRVREKDHDSVMITLADAPGSFTYFKLLNQQGDDPAGMLVACPCGCGRVSTLYFVALPNKPKWTKTGGDDNLTLTPSLGIMGAGVDDIEADGYHWHGWLKNGMWESC